MNIELKFGVLEMINEEKIRQAVKMIIEAVGENPDREGLKDTPDRIARMYAEIFSGLNESPKKYLSRSFIVEDDDMIIEKDITFYSMCEHHFLPFFGKVHIVYIPDGKVAGLSKLARTVEVFSKRPQLQERLTSQIAESLMEHLKAKGVMVMIEAEHLCMSMRGVKKPGSKTITVVSKGIIKENENIKKEAYSLLNIGN